MHEGKIADSNEAEAEAKSIIAQKLPRRDELEALKKANRDRVMERKVGAGHRTARRAAAALTFPPSGP